MYFVKRIYDTFFYIKYKIKITFYNQNIEFKEIYLS